MTGYQQYGIGARMGMTAYSFMFYPSKFLWWADLSPLYELPAGVDPLAPRFLLPMIGLAVLTALLVGLRRRWPAALAAWVYSALLVLPVTGAVVHAGVQLVADRYSYLSGLGFALLAGAVLVWVLQARRRFRRSLVGACVLLAVLVLTALGVGARRQAKFWRDSETLWRHALSVDSRDARARYNLGNWLIAVGRLPEARAEYELALAFAERPDVKAASYAGLGRVPSRKEIWQGRSPIIAPPSACQTMLSPSTTSASSRPNGEISRPPSACSCRPCGWFRATLTPVATSTSSLG